MTRGEEWLLYGQPTDIKCGVCPYSSRPGMIFGACPACAGTGLTPVPFLDMED